MYELPSPISIEIYNALVKVFGDPKNLRYLKKAPFTQAQIRAATDAAVAVWAMEHKKGVQTRAALSVGIDRNSIARHMKSVSVKNETDALGQFMDSLRVDLNTPIA